MEMTAVGKKLRNWLKTGNLFIHLQEHYITGDDTVPIKIGVNVVASELSVIVDYGGVEVMTLLNSADNYYLGLEVRSLIDNAKRKRQAEFIAWVDTK